MTQDEEFSVLEGKLAYSLNGKEGLLNVGETINLPAGLPHTIWNAEPSKTVVQKVGLYNALFSNDSVLFC